MKTVIRSILSSLIILPLIVFDAHAAQRDLPTQQSTAEAVAQGAMVEMVTAVRSNSRAHERKAVVAKLKATVDSMHPHDRLVLIDEMIKALDAVQTKSVEEIKPWEMGTFVTAMGGLLILLYHHPAKRASALIVGGAMLVGGVYAQVDLLSTESVMLHAAQLRSELFVLRSVTELNLRATELK